MLNPLRSKRLLLSILLGAGLTACGGGSGSTPMLDLNFKNLENLGSAAVYEGWLLVDGAPVTTGRFTVNDNGVLSQSSFAVSQSHFDKATAFILTVEPAVNDVAAPSDQHLVAGGFDSSRYAGLLTSHPAALNTDFTSASGSFILATPSTAITTDNDQGIWFLSAASGSAQASLKLPALPKGWVYEGWVVVNGKPVTTGRFTNPALADSDGAGPGAGPLSGPPFPGQDYINPALKLPGGMAVISVEPEPDNSPDPFLIKPLVNTNIPGATGGENNHPLSNRGSAVLPSGSAVLVYK